MRSTFSVLFFIRRERKNKDGYNPLMCRITLDGQDTRFSMKTDVNPLYWDATLGKAKGKSVEAGETNLLIENTRATIFKIYRELQDREMAAPITNCQIFPLGSVNRSGLFRAYEYRLKFWLKSGACTYGSGDKNLPTTRSYNLAFILISPNIGKCSCPV